LKYFLKNLIFITLISLFTACSIKNPFVPPANYASYERQEPITCEPISTEPMYRATMRPYTVMGKQYCPTVVKVGDIFKGTASWYGDAFHGKQTSNGEYYNMHDQTAAHKTLPINTKVKVAKLRNNQTTIVRINDRGPFVDDRIIDLSFQAAQDIDMIKKGTAPVKLEVIHFDNSANKYAHKKPEAQKLKPSKKTVWKRFEQPEKKLIKETDEPKIVSGGDYVIQIASLSFKDKAIALKEKCYNGNGRYNPHIKEKAYNNQTIYKVMLGGFQSIQEAKDFIQKRVNDQIALVVFGNFAYVASPLTYDKKIIKQILDKLYATIAGANYTVINDSLFQSAKLFEKSKAKSKVIILLTDGQSRGDNIPFAVSMRLIKQHGIKVHTIGIGQKGDFNEDYLKLIAQKSGGQFFSANNPNALQEVYAKIDQLEKSQIENSKYTKKDYLFELPLFMAFMALLFYTYLLNKRGVG